jgi:hypothetical protein
MVLADVLPPLVRLSRALQDNQLTVADVPGILEATETTLEEYKDRLLLLLLCLHILQYT